MNGQTLLKSLAGLADDARQVPAQADVLLLQTPSRDELHARARRFLALFRAQDGCERDDAGAWHERPGQTAVLLPEGARAIVHHASGALRYISGLAPADAPFERDIGRDALVRLVEERARALSLPDWAGTGAGLQFERLFRTLGRGADREGKQSAATLFRATGSYRQRIGDLPVLGGASAAVRLAGDGRLDGLSILMRPAGGDVLERADVIAPEAGARQIVAQLSALLGQREVPDGIVESAAMQFGYLDLGKRKAQRVLAPTYVARIVLRHRAIRQAYVLAARATERPYLELPVYGSEAGALQGRKTPRDCHDGLR